MEPLRNLFLRYGTDKEMNGYTPYYERLFESARHKKVRLAEIGIGTLIPNAPSSMVGYGEANYRTGASLMAWRDFFDHPESEVHGFDIASDTQITGEDRVTTHLLNSTDRAAVDQFLAAHPEQFDIIVDDGCHRDTSQLETVRNLWRALKPGGYYVIEDIYPGSRLVTDFRGFFDCVVENSPWLLSTKQNLLFIFKQ